jgi:hypothetical protein
MVKKHKKGGKENVGTVAAKVENGEMTIADAQKLINIRKLEASVTDDEESTRDHTTLIDLRQTWGKVILGVLIATVVCDFFLIAMVGSGHWKFESNTYFLNVVITEHLVQIFGLVIIVLKSLFPKK